MIGSVLWELFGLALLLGCAALLNGAEAAYFSLGRHRLRTLAADDETSSPLAPLLARPHNLLITVL